MMDDCSLYNLTLSLKQNIVYSIFYMRSIGSKKKVELKKTSMNN